MSNEVQELWCHKPKLKAQTVLKKKGIIENMQNYIKAHKIEIVQSIIRENEQLFLFGLVYRLIDKNNYTRLKRKV